MGTSDEEHRRRQCGCLGAAIARAVAASRLRGCAGAGGQERRHHWRGAGGSRAYGSGGEQAARRSLAAELPRRESEGVSAF